MDYREFVQEVRIAWLREGRDGLRVVGQGSVLPDGRRAIGLVVPHLEVGDCRRWESEYRYSR